MYQTNSHHNRFWTFKQLLPLILAVLLVTSCDSPEAPDNPPIVIESTSTVSAITREYLIDSPITSTIGIVVTPPINVLYPNQSVVISVSSEILDSELFQWSVSPDTLGTLSATNGNLSTFQASESGPGEVTINIRLLEEPYHIDQQVTFYILGETNHDRSSNLGRSEPGAIAYTCCQPSNEAVSCDNICRIELNDLRIEQLTDNIYTDFYSSPAPDGGSILYSAMNPSGEFQINEYALEDGKDRVVLSLAGYDLFAPTYSTSGRLAYAARRKDNYSDQTIWIHDGEGNSTRLTEPSYSSLDPVWSGDGTRIFYYSYIEDVDNPSHFVMNSDGSNLQKIVIPEIENIEVKSIGGRSDVYSDENGVEWLAFYAGDRRSKRVPDSCLISEIGNREIYLVRVDGSEIRQLTNGGDNTAPGFSPDGKWITFMSYRDGDSEIYIMRTDGSNVQQITRNETCDYQPRWGTD